MTPHPEHHIEKSIDELVVELKEDFQIDEPNFGVIYGNIEKLVDETVLYFGIKNGDYKIVAKAYEFITQYYLDRTADYLGKKTKIYIRQGYEMDQIKFTIQELDDGEPRLLVQAIYKNMGRDHSVENILKRFLGEPEDPLFI